MPCSRKAGSVSASTTWVSAHPRARRYAPEIEGEKADSATDATGAMLRTIAPASAPPDFLYRVYSAVMHGEVYGLMNFMTPGSPPPVPPC